MCSSDLELYGYRLLPGTLFIFLVGFAFARDGAWRFFPWLVWAAALALYLFINATPHLLGLRYSKEVLLGLLVGIPSLAILKLTQFSRIDELLGNLSYGLFLNHYFCIWALQAAGLQLTEVVEWFLLFAISLTLSVVTYYAIELPALRWRRKLRYRASANDHVLDSKR